jgi:hypothetical protein
MLLQLVKHLKMNFLQLWQLFTNVSQNTSCHVCSQYFIHSMIMYQLLAFNFLLSPEISALQTEMYTFFLRQQNTDFTITNEKPLNLGIGWDRKQVIVCFD